MPLCSERAEEEHKAPGLPINAPSSSSNALEQQEEEDEESAEAVAAYKARLVELLQPGETVLDALRRLALHSGEAEESRPEVGASATFWRMSMVIIYTVGLFATRRREGCSDSEAR